jgi:hypothetical protein
MGLKMNRRREVTAAYVEQREIILACGFFLAQLSLTGIGE